jgi:hypothetical protein
MTGLRAPGSHSRKHTTPSEEKWKLIDGHAFSPITHNFLQDKGVVSEN